MDPPSVAASARSDFSLVLYAVYSCARASGIRCGPAVAAGVGPGFKRAAGAAAGAGARAHDDRVSEAWRDPGGTQRQDSAAFDRARCRPLGPRGRAGEGKGNFAWRSFTRARRRNQAGIRMSFELRPCGEVFFFLASIIYVFFSPFPAVFFALFLALSALDRLRKVENHWLVNERTCPSIFRGENYVGNGNRALMCT